MFWLRQLNDDETRRVSPMTYEARIVDFSCLRERSTIPLRMCTWHLLLKIFKLCIATLDSSRKLQKGEITLQDSLACSGCITCAEGVSITQQCPEELLKVLNEDLRKILRSSSCD
uniref:Uncharacterized protein n=1 Tax=Glossina pallidipes TaxID=7398 RepID=A0A1A9ZQX8_GLOPL